VTAITGPYGAQPSQFGELTSFAITKNANKDAARLVEFMMNDGYLDWLALAPEGKVPVRTGTPDQPDKFTDAWHHLKTGVESRKPLSEVYPPEVLNELATSTETMNRRRFPKARAGWSAPSLPPCPSPRSWPPPSTAPSRRPPRPNRPRPTSSRSPSRSPEPAPAHRLCQAATGPGGHEKSRPVVRIRGCRHSPQRLERSKVAEAFDYSPAIASPRALAHEAVAGRASPYDQVQLTPRPCIRVVLPGRATTVPVTAVLNGLLRTTTDKHEAASTCAVRHPRSS
jgi:hypothetical protein